MATVYGYLPGLSLPAPPFICQLSSSALFQMSLCLLYKGEGWEVLRQISGPARRLLYHRLFNPKLFLGWKYTRLPWIGCFLRLFASPFQYVIHWSLQPEDHALWEFLVSTHFIERSMNLWAESIKTTRKWCNKKWNSKIWPRSDSFQLWVVCSCDLFVIESFHSSLEGHKSFI